MRRVIEKAATQKWLDALGRRPAEAKYAGLSKELYRLVSKPKRQRISVNLQKLGRLAGESENVIVPGKVLGNGSLDKKLNISAIEYSKSALEKLKSRNCSVIELEEMLKKENVRIIV
ncbi:MAG: uL15 family ribosomal protein [Candidatus Marsarchaeota archaeon]|jgi:large subunit ribosomal protein L18e|nr:uL15 family ribosomal protein [Candidatus Marsarchaeota archaeon]